MKKKLCFVSPSEMSPGPCRGCIQRAFVLTFWSQHTCPSSWDAVLPSSQSYSKTIPVAAGSISSCIIYLNTCLTILDSARSWKGGATGPPKIPSQYGCICWSVFILQPRRAVLFPKSGSAHTIHQWIDVSKKYLQCHVLKRSQETHVPNAMLMWIKQRASNYGN